jgi:hypothetical protein
MTEGDCERVGKHMRSVWDAEASATAPENGAAIAERAKLVIKGEGDRMEAEWNADCRRELEGRKVDDKEVECILAAKSIAEIQRCAQEKK